MLLQFAAKCKDILMFFVLLPFVFPDNVVMAKAGQSDLAASYTASDTKDLITLLDTAERRHGIPLGLLKSIAHVESGAMRHCLNVAGKTVKAKSAIEALEIVRGELAKGNNNIDVGVMQVNLRWHGDKFASLEEMLQPLENIEYASKLLCELKKRHGSWHKAVRYYHSTSPEHHKQYSRKVLLSWLK